MRKIALVLVGLTLTTGAIAQSRPYSPRLSCASAARLIASRGAVLMSTGPSTFDRFVRDRGFCTPSETTRTAFVPTADNPQCFVGYTCEEFHRDQWPF